MTLKEIIEKLSAMYGPTSFEQPVTDWLMDSIKPYCDEAYTDVMGNLIAVRKCGKENAPKILVDAHIDEIGLIVTGIEKGFLRFATLGGVDPRILPALQVKVLTDPPIHGIVDSLPPHALSASEMEKPFEVTSLSIDIGMTQEEAEALVALGTPVVFDVDPVMLGEHRLCGKSLDDRACAAIICKVMENLVDVQLNADMYYMFSAQEEVGARGGQTGAFGIAPDYAIVMDVNFAKSPDSNGYDQMDMGGGPAIAVGPNMNHKMSSALIALAKEMDMPYQVDVIRAGSGTNAVPIQISRGGVATALISLPLKYMHTPHEVMDLRDGENIVKLVSEYIRRF